MRTSPVRPWPGLPAVAALLLSLLVSAPDIGRAQEKAAASPSAPPTAPRSGDDIADDARRRFWAEDWAGLEAVAQAMRERKSRLPDGRWHLPFFYDLFDPRLKARKEEDWQKFLAKLDVWRAAAPNSVTQTIGRADFLTHYAWEARDGNSTGRLAEARALLETIPDTPDRCLHWAAVMQSVARGQKWERADYERLFAYAVGREPAYHEYYFRKVYYLVYGPGEWGEWERFALEAAEANASGEGMALYTRMALQMKGYYSDGLLNGGHVTWEKLRAGFRALVEQFPASTWNRNLFALWAVEARDRETAREAVAGLGNRSPDPVAWGGPGPIAVARAWMDPATPARQLEPVARFVRADAPRPGVYALAVAPDGKSLAAGYEDGKVVVWALPAGTELWRGTVSPRRRIPVTGVAFSPDGQLLAAGISEVYDTNGPGTVRIWETAGERREVAALTPFKGGACRVAWTPDGRTLAMAGGTFNKAGEGYLWDRASGEIRSMYWPTDHKHQVHAIAYSRDGKILAAECNRSITVWDVSENLMRHDSQQTLSCYTMALAFSPDGKHLALAGKPDWGLRCFRAGTVVLFDAATWKERPTPRVSANTGGLHALAYSPDGRWLAGASVDRGVYVWEANTLGVKGIYVAHRRPVQAVAFSPDNRTLISGAEDGAILLWEAPAE